MSYEQHMKHWKNHRKDRFYQQCSGYGGDGEVHQKTSEELIQLETTSFVRLLQETKNIGFPITIARSGGYYHLADKNHFYGTQIESYDDLIQFGCKYVNGLSDMNAFTLNEKIAQVEAAKLVKDIFSHDNGHMILAYANLIHSLKAESVLSDDEVLRMSERLYNTISMSVEPLFMAERIDAVVYLLNYGVSGNRFSDLPNASPGQMKNFLLSCDEEIFVDLVDKVATEDRAIYAPEGLVEEQVKAIENALLDFVDKKPGLDDVIAEVKTSDRVVVGPRESVSEPEL